MEMTIMMNKIKFFKKYPYAPPKWSKCLKKNPKEKINLGNFPTPIFPFQFSGLPNNVNVFIKRDDLSGSELSGNKTRKLEFLLADAINKGADCIVTAGGIQSNHCRATAVAARMLDMDSHLLLRTVDPTQDPGLVGNLLINRLVGSKLILLSREEYTKYGSEAIISATCSKLSKKGLNPYPIPVGGSNGLGTWGYIDAVSEIHQQLRELDISISDIAFACGSGGSSTGLALGFYLFSQHYPSTSPKFHSCSQPPAHAYSVCDTPNYFHEFINSRLLPELGMIDGVKSEDFLQITNATGRGYAWSTNEELEFIQQVAFETGIVLDPVYTGKAFYQLVKDLKVNQKKFSGKNILFVHTGGLLGLYDKAKALQEIVRKGDVSRFKML